MNKKKIINNLTGYGFILPALLVIGVFFIYPAFQLIKLSFSNYNMMAGNGDFVGVKNYMGLMQDKEFFNSLWVTLKLAIFIVPVQTFLALIMAVFVNQKLPCVKIFKTIYFIPAITSFVAVAILWKQMYNPTFGLMNSIMKAMGFGPFQYLSSKSQAIISMGITCVWKSWGYFMVIFFSGLQEISGEIKEAAKLDGVNFIQEFFYITLPMVKRTMLFVMIITTMDAIKLFIPPFTMTSGGPINSTNTIVHYIWRQAFRLQQVGPATAMAIVLCLIVIIITAVQFKFGDKED